MSGWAGLRKRSRVPEAYRPLIGLTLDEAKAYVARETVIGVGSGGGMRIKEFRAVDLDDEREVHGETADWRVERLRIYLKSGVVVDVGDVG